MNIFRGSHISLSEPFPLDLRFFFGSCFDENKTCMALAVNLIFTIFHKESELKIIIRWILNGRRRGGARVVDIWFLI